MAADNGASRKLAAAAMAAAMMTAPAARAEVPASAPAPEIKIGMIDTVVYRLPIRDRNVSVVSKDMTDGHAARWDGESGHSHGELVAASAARAARVQSPDARITIYAANVYRPSDADVTRDRFSRTGQSDPDANRVHLTLDYNAADRAISWMKQEGVSVVVITATGQDTPRMKAMADKVRDAGMVLVASTNNAFVRGKVFPAAYPEVISVAGSDRSLPIWQSPELASYVSYMADARAPIKENVREVGSSFAAGSVAGALAARAASGSMTTAAARQWLDGMSTSVDCGPYKVRSVAIDVRRDPGMESVRTLTASAAAEPVASASPASSPAPVQAARGAVMAAMLRGGMGR